MRERSPLCPTRKLKTFSNYIKEYSKMFLYRRGTVGFLGGLSVALLLAGCAGEVQVGDVGGKVYVYEKEGFGGEFLIQMKEDNTFEYYEGFLSSYIGAGKWQLDGNTLLIRDTVISWDVKENYFAVDGNDLVFLAGESDNFTHLTVSDGERFVGHPMEEYFPTKSE